MAPTSWSSKLIPPRAENGPGVSKKPCARGLKRLISLTLPGTKSISERRPRADSGGSASSVSVSTAGTSRRSPGFRLDDLGLRVGTGAAAAAGAPRIWVCSCCSSSATST
eukprot:Amastigsp_a852499_8.p3 type:complete len:110 gc:universal Amastigsp_a852499_8:50-379(+)